MNLSIRIAERYRRYRAGRPTPVEQPAAWPEDVTGRYITVGGATADVFDTNWTCRGCPGTSYGKYTNPWGMPLTNAEAHQQAQEHAETCRAMPRTT